MEMRDEQASARVTSECVRYARTELKPFWTRYQAQIKHLFGALAFVPELSKKQGPYVELLSESNWQMLEHNFVKDFCRLQGMSQESGLYQITKAGTLAIPKMAKVLGIIKGKDDWLANKEMPCEVELGPEFTFHNVFICPVSKEISTPDNPPMLLTCGHVVSK